MSIVFVPLNGIGLGHVSRSFALACALRGLGEAPVILSQGIYPDFMAAEIPGETLGTLYLLGEAGRNKAARRIAKAARRTRPAVIIEDTHPSTLRFTSDVLRLLIVRPVEIESMRELNAQCREQFRRFLIADHPDSPTWPYDEPATAEIFSWPGWSAMGPVFRAPTAEGCERVRKKYSLDAGQPLYVFTMGGGGSQPGSHDAAWFVARSAEIATCIHNRHPDARFIFIRGPLFPANFEIPPVFENYAVEPEMPSLLAEAGGVIARRSLNATWECLASGAPLLGIPGSTYVEPAGARLERSTRAGLVPADFEQWLDPSWRDAYRRIAAAMVARWPLQEAAKTLQACWSAEPRGRPGRWFTWFPKSRD